MKKRKRRLSFLAVAMVITMVFSQLAFAASLGSLSPIGEDTVSTESEQTLLSDIPEAADPLDTDLQVDADAPPDADPTDTNEDPPAQSDETTSESDEEDLSSSVPGESSEEEPSSSDPEQSEESSTSGSESESSSGPENEETDLNAPTEDTILGRAPGFLVEYFEDNSFQNSLGEEFVAPNSMLTRMPEPPSAPAGKTFAGWTDDGTNVYNGESRITKSLKLYPKWVEPPKEYTVTFQKTDGTAIASKKVTAGSSLGVNMPSNPGADGGAGFIGWYTDTNHNYRFYSSTSVNSDLTVYPFWGYTITYNYQNGSGTRTTSVFKGEQLTLPNAPTKTETKEIGGVSFVIDYIFDGWSYSGTSALPGAQITVNSNLAISGTWTERTDGVVNVTLKTGGYKNSQGQTLQDISITGVAKGAVIKEFPTVNDTGKTLRGWYVAGTDGSASSTQWIANSTKFTENTTLIPVFDKITGLSVTFKANGETLKTLSGKTFGDTISKADAPTVPDLVQTVESGGKEYTITYQSNGKWANSADPNRALWVFAEESNPTEIQEKSIILNAVYEWKEGELPPGSDTPPGISPEFCLIKFDAGNGSQVISKTVFKGQQVSAIDPEPTRKGYKFIRWNKKDTATEYNFTAPVNTDLNLVAVWEEYAHIVFNSEAGNYISAPSVEIGKTIDRPTPDPVKRGYEFVGWSRTRQLKQDSSEFQSSAFDFSTPITASMLTPGNNSMTLWAWYKSTTTVKYHLNNATDEKEETIIIKEIREGDPLKLPYVDIARKEYPKGSNFENWTLTRNGTNVATPKVYPLVRGETLEVYAKWIEGFSVTFDYSEGFGGQPPDGTVTKQMISYKKGWEGPIQPPRPVINNHIIKSWKLDDSTEITDHFAQILEDAEDITVYANWEEITVPIPCTVTFDFNDASQIPPETTAATVGGKFSSLRYPNKSKGDLIAGGWFYDKELNQPMLPDDLIPGDITLYAQWVYRVDFFPGQELEVESQFVVPNSTVEPPQDTPQKPGIVFVGWTQDQTPSQDSDLWDFWKPVGHPLKLYGVWGYSITFNAGEGSPTPEQQIVRTKGQTINKPTPDPELSDENKFLGWFIDDTTQFYFNGDENHQATPVTESLVLYAKYDKYENLGIFRLNVQIQKGGKIKVDPQGRHQAGDKIPLELEALPEYEFLGWSSSAEGEFEDSKALTTIYTMPAKNSSIVAQFQKIKKPAPPVRPINPGNTGNVSNGGDGGGGSSGTTTPKLNSRTTNTNLNTNRTARPAQAKYGMNQTTKVSQTQMDSMIQQNATKDVVLSSEDFVFTFQKGTMEKVPGVESYDFGGSFEVKNRSSIEGLAGNALALCVSYNYDGPLPAEAAIDMNVGKQYAGQTLYYYYYNPETQALEYMQNVEIDKDGWASIRQSHFSEYAFLTKKLYSDGNDTQSAMQSSNNSSKTTVNVAGNSTSAQSTSVTSTDVNSSNTGTATGGAKATNGLLPAAGQGSSMALLGFAGASFAASLFFMYRFKKEWENTDEDEE